MVAASYASADCLFGERIFFGLRRCCWTRRRLAGKVKVWFDVCCAGCKRVALGRRRERVLVLIVVAVVDIA